MQLGNDQTGKLNHPGQGEGVGHDHRPNLVVGRGQVERHEGKPVDGVDAVREEDETGLVKTSRAFSSFESIEGGEKDQEARESQANYESAIGAEIVPGDYKANPIFNDCY